MALGATRSQIASATMLPTVRFAAAGAVAGFAGALALGRAMRAALYETSPLDPGVLAGSVSILLAVTIAASYLPLRRALRVDPAAVLRNE